RVISAPFAETDPATREFSDSYFKPHNIKSLLDAPLQNHSGGFGVICCEAVGEVREWQADEIGFIASIAQLISAQIDAKHMAELNREIQVALTAAEAAGKAKSGFVATMNHELRTPMNGILGAANILVDGDLQPKEQRLAQAIVRSGDTLMSILNDILDFSKFDADIVEVEEIPFSLREVMSEIQSIHSISAKQKGVELAVEPAPSEAGTVMGDPQRIKQVLHNLVSNAIKFTNRGSVVVRCSLTDAGNLQLTVKDSGIGIAQDRLAEIRQPFVQADSSITRQYGGTGLGLSIVDRLVGAMQGTVQITSALGQGTEVIVSIPVRAATAADKVGIVADEASEAQREDMFEPGVRVLIVDDNPTNLLILSTLMEKQGATTVAAHDGYEAIEAFKCGDFDAILMDIHMPKMGGVEAMTRIRTACGERGQSVPIIAVSADTMPDQVRHYLDQGFDAFIEKPIQKSALFRTLKKSLEDGGAGLLLREAE
ncbi:MAG: ATP-binding protein, partial [Pseudomonadota bacterium]